MTEELAGDKLPPETSGGGQRTCALRRADGHQCKARPLVDSDFCFFHDEREEIVQKRIEGRRIGGKKRVWTGLGHNRKRNMDDLESVRGFLNETANAVMEGRMDAKIGNCLAGISSVLYRMIEARDVGTRLDEIERQLEAVKRQRRALKDEVGRWKNRKE